ncbi:MAG: hypothetical protein NZ528_14790 [Caldilineales bacterium]|nr:hypothetical protein [Caldilineales bacterium]MDW8318673.1 hypothetical protein [Anaerolineae bacterium]
MDTPAMQPWAFSLAEMVPIRANLEELKGKGLAETGEVGEEE